MKTHVLAIGFALAAGAVNAQGFQGGDVGVDLTRNTGDFAQGHYYGSATYGITPSLITQVDLGYTDYYGVNFGGARTIGGHLGYQLSPTAVIGGFWGFEDWPRGNYQAYGIEAKTSAGAIAGNPLTLEGYLVNYSQNGGSYSFGGGGIDAGLQVSPASTLKLGLFSSGGDLDNDRVSIGMNYAIGNGLNVGLEAGHVFQPGSDENTFGLNLSYKLGNGATFKERNFTSFLPGL